MPKKNPAQSYDSYEVITQEDPETGDMLIPIPPHLLKELGWKEGDMVNAENYYRHCISLPMYPTLTDDEQNFVIEKIEKFYN